MLNNELVDATATHVIDCNLQLLAPLGIKNPPVEFRLLVAILEADGRVLSRDQLLDAVYGPDAEGLLDRTIDVHVGRLRDKLGDLATTPRFIATVRGVGYRAVQRQTLPLTTPAVGATDR